MRTAARYPEAERDSGAQEDESAAGHGPRRRAPPGPRGGLPGRGGPRLGLQDDRLGRLIDQEQGLEGLLQPLPQPGDEIARQGRRLLVQLQSQAAMELHALPQRRVDLHAALEDGALIRGQSVVEVQVHRLEQRRLERPLPLPQAAARLEQPGVHDVGRHDEHLADRLVLQSLRDPEHQDGARHRVESRQRPPRRGV